MKALADTGNLKHTGNKQLQRILKFILKLGLSAACIWYLSTKIDMDASLSAIGKINPLYFIAAVIVFLVSKAFSSVRLNLYFKDIGIHLKESTNLRLYLLGMFMNLFLPGSIGGDAYKVYRLNTAFDTGYKKTIVAVLFDRFSGLLALFIFMIIAFIITVQGAQQSLFLLVLAPVAIGCLYFIVKRFFAYLIPSFWKTFFYGLLVQALQMLCMLIVLLALQVNRHYIGYQTIFLLSSAVAVLPFTIGGLGAREIVFLWGADYLHLDHNAAVTASFIFYLVNVVSCLTGLPFLFFDPLTKNDSNAASNMVEE